MANTIDLRGLVRPQLVEATKREDNPNVAEFRLQPLERGFGHTLGNAMRRMLLSSLRGAAVWAFRIDGVVHEHQTIPGVVEDVHQIIGNLKTLTLTLPEDVEDVVLHISKSESGAVTAADISSSGGVRIVDPGHHLFTLQDDRDLNVDLYVNKGRGYSADDQQLVVTKQKEFLAMVLPAYAVAAKRGSISAAIAESRAAKIIFGAPSGVAGETFIAAMAGGMGVFRR